MCAPGADYGNVLTTLNPAVTHYVETNIVASEDSLVRFLSDTLETFLENVRVNHLQLEPPKTIENARQLYLQLRLLIQPTQAELYQ